MLVNGRIGALDDYNPLVSDVGPYSNFGFAVGKVGHFDRESFAPSLAERLVAISRDAGRRNCPVQSFETASRIFAAYKNR